jgi:hypothetical protein
MYSKAVFLPVCPKESIPSRPRRAACVLRLLLHRRKSAFDRAISRRIKESRQESEVSLVYTCLPLS